MSSKWTRARWHTVTRSWCGEVCAFLLLDTVLDVALLPVVVLGWCCLPVGKADGPCLK